MDEANNCLGPHLRDFLWNAHLPGIRIHQAAKVAQQLLRGCHAGVKADQLRIQLVLQQHMLSVLQVASPGCHVPGLELLPFTVYNWQDVILKARTELIQPELVRHLGDNGCPHLIQFRASAINRGKPVGVVSPCLPECPGHLLRNKLAGLVLAAGLAERVDPIHHHPGYRVLPSHLPVVGSVFIACRQGLTVD